MPNAQFIFSEDIENIQQSQITGWSAYSQCDEDGIIRECLHRLAKYTNLSHSFVEVGCEDGLENNTHLLLLNGYRGVWIEREEEKIRIIDEILGGTVFEKLWVLKAEVTLDSAGSLARHSKRFLGVESLDFLSLDIDGNDWHVLPTFLRELQPKLVCVEYNAKFPPPTRLVMQYSKLHSWSGSDYYGASLQSFVDLLTEHSYALVCCNSSGVNAFFVRSDLLQGFISYSAEQLYKPARYHLANISKGYPPSLSWIKQVLQNGESDQSNFVPAVLGSTPIQFAVHSRMDQCCISPFIAKRGVWEPFESKVFGYLCKPADTVLDLGANVGWYSLLAANIVGSDGRVLAFEPDETNVRLLEMNAAVSDPHGIIQIYHSAVGEREEEGFLYKSTTNFGDHRIFSDGLPRDKSPVCITSLDAFFASKNQKLPDIVKADTQGSEAKILKGAKGLFSQGWRPVMFLEFWPFGFNNYGDDPLLFWQELVGLGYKTFEVSESNPKLVPINVNWLKMRLESDISPSSEGFINLICIPDGSDRLNLIADLLPSTISKQALKKFENIYRKYKRKAFVRGKNINPLSEIVDSFFKN